MSLVLLTDTYLSLEEADYLLGGNNAWIKLGLDQATGVYYPSDTALTKKEALLKRTAKQIDLLSIWKGSKADSGQALEFPRNFGETATIYLEAAQLAALKVATVKQIEYILATKLYGYSDLSQNTGPQNAPEQVGMAPGAISVLSYYMYARFSVF